MRDMILRELRQRNLFPRVYDYETVLEQQIGLYPDIEDPQFTKKLLRKQEFSENRQDPLQDQFESGVNPCDPEGEFELTPVQRFIGRFLSPECPYQSALLYHGVGVGKTCAGITVAENFLRNFPRRKVLVIAPPTIQPGFRRTIFDMEGLQIPEDENVPNTAKGCTGNTYLKISGMEFQKEKKLVQTRVKAIIDSRYEFMGYIQFKNYIDSLLKNIPRHHDEERRAQEELAILRREFNGRLLIIDEAHNLRDVPSETEDENLEDDDTTRDQSSAGKKLTPSLVRLLQTVYGMKLLLMTGTPMYNTYREIIFMMNLLLMNDKRATLQERDIFTRADRFTTNGAAILGSVASVYVSFMRGENPLSFPVRLQPQGVPRLTSWPSLAPDSITETPEDMFEKMSRMPFVPVMFEGAVYDEYLELCRSATERGRMGIRSLDEMVQAGNWMFPGGTGEARIRKAGFDAAFEEVREGMLVSYRARGSPAWLDKQNIKAHSPKAHFILNRVARAKGVVFVYSRYVVAGGLTLALALEANGYTLVGRTRPLFVNGALDGKGRQCADCPLRENEHAPADHRFVPANYVILTGSADISPHNPTSVDLARSEKNIDGGRVKVILGSQVASEGVDFRFIREIYVFDSWFHLNKLEQVIGRGVRNCSHSLLDARLRNCTLYWLVNTFQEDTGMESADLYMYRNAFQKAVQVGRVTRVLKQYALDCNLNRDAIVVDGFAPRVQIDSQGETREGVDINDTPFTSMCDWLETCDYKCAIPVSFEGKLDMSTYDEYAARWRESGLKKQIKAIFEENDQIMYRFDQLVSAFAAVPPLALSMVLSDIIGNDSFQLNVNGKRGYLIYKNGYYLFQPTTLKQHDIPLSLRIADIPVKRDFYDFRSIRKLVKKGTLDVSFWTTMVEWAKQIRDGIAPLTLPEVVLGVIAARYPGSSSEQKNDIQRMEMVVWLYVAMKENDVWRKRLSEILLECIWDTTLNMEEQKGIIDTGDGFAKIIAREQILKNGSTEVFRYVNVSTGELDYICKKDKCSPAVVAVFEKRDPMNEMAANIETTGPIYGFLVPIKRGELAFKTSEKPPPVGQKPEKGGECAILSAISIHNAMLDKIGDILREQEISDFGFSEEAREAASAVHRQREEKEKELRRIRKLPSKPNEDRVVAELGALKEADRSYQNAARACMLKELMLRWMDMMELSDKTWFYRPIAAYKTFHRYKPIAGATPSKK